MSSPESLARAPRGPLTPSAACGAQANRVTAAPRVLPVDADASDARILAELLSPEACVIHVSCVSDALRLVEHEQFALIVLDPNLPDGDGQTLMGRAAATPVLLYANHVPDWRTNASVVLLKHLTSHRKLWVTISTMLGIDANMFLRSAL